MLPVLEADRARIADLQTRIVQLECALSQLRLEKSEVQERLDSYKYPVLTLPNEITSEIFLHILPHFPPLTGSHSPTVLTHICRQWREIALDIPKLWSAIAFYDDPQEWEPHIFELWLQRSRDSPLSIRLETATWANHQLVEAMLPHRARWDYLKTDFDEAEHRRTLDAPMPLLRHLDMTMEKVDDSLDPIALHGVPLLRTVVLNGLAALRVILPWTQLTSLTLIAVYPSECVPILVQTRNLVHCELQTFFQATFGSQRPDITLQCLESLVLSDFDEEPVTGFLPTFVVPALQSLTVPEGFLAPNPIDCLTSFISKSGCTLLNLHLTGARSVSAKSYREAFPSLPKILFNSKMDHDERRFGGVGRR
ncbi:hypothetical protein DFH06DRAFT_710003 [Mycena polygramma]|nr:hypothetical protein DFH06DRAFT_710003 [Mycena polygramma]